MVSIVKQPLLQAGLMVFKLLLGQGLGEAGLRNLKFQQAIMMIQEEVVVEEKV